ncbi:centromere protein U [Labrus mixtus]|uniref:centromere protein U n=1 Tax=Labrus mixtus TaxID=508554 RepID=UPI0029C0A2F3|nr:centromere protein U [Labrus mixtus]
MSAKKGRRAKAPKKDENQKGSAMDGVDSPNLSAIERASFMEGLQPNFGNPLHSTAVEEDLNVSGGQKEDGRKGVPKTSKTFVKQRGAAVKRKETERDAENGEEEEKKQRSRSTAGNVKAGKVKNQQVTVKKRKSKSGSGQSNDPQSQEESDTDTARQTRKTILSSDEELVDEDTSWSPSQKKTKANSLRGTRKSSPGSAKSRTSSSGSESAEADKADTETQRSKKQSGQRGTELEVVLDTFSHFCDQYRESVESKAVKQSIDSFSTNVKQQLMEKISANKELGVLKRENVKVGSLIRKKTQRLLDAKHEMMKAERKVFLLKKEKAELKLRLSDLRQGQAFLQDVRELNRQYLYGASSLPALQLETKLLKAAERHP